MKPNRDSQYICPHGKLDGKSYIEDKGGAVSGRYCKNNCSLYNNNECKRWK